jgi:small subunit ribosomal protein S6
VANYETVFIARQDITANQVEGLVDIFEKVIVDAGGIVPKKESWGLKTLAYKIKKNRKGHYSLMNISAPAEAVHEMERQMRINEDVLRYITIRVDELEENPSVMMRSRDREERPRRDRGNDRAPHNGEEQENEAASEHTVKAESTVEGDDA